MHPFMRLHYPELRGSDACHSKTFWVISYRNGQTNSPLFLSSLSLSAFFHRYARTSSGRAAMALVQCLARRSYVLQTRMASKKVQCSNACFFPYYIQSSVLTPTACAGRMRYLWVQMKPLILDTVPSILVSVSTTLTQTLVPSDRDIGPTRTGIKRVDLLFVSSDLFLYLHKYHS